MMCPSHSDPWMEKLKTVMHQFLNLGIDVMFTAILLKHNLITFQDQDRILAEKTDERKCFELFKVLLRNGPACEPLFREILVDTDRLRYAEILDTYQPIENNNFTELPSSDTSAITIEEILDDDDDERVHSLRSDASVIGCQELEIASLTERANALELAASECKNKVKELESTMSNFYKHLPPSTPELVMAAMHGTTFRWRHHHPQELGVTGYKILLKDQKGGERVLERKLRENDLYEVKDLELDVQYEISVCTIFKGQYESCYGPVLQFTPIPSPGPIEQIKDLTKHNQVAIKWKPSLFEGKEVSHYEVKIINSTGVEQSAEASIGDWESGKFILKALEAGESYSTAICSVFADGIKSGYSQFTQVYTRPSSPPTHVNWRKELHAFQTVVEWKAPEIIGKNVRIENYVIHRLKGRNGQLEKWSVSALQSETGDYTHCVPGYWWDVGCLRIKAVCGLGEPEVKYQSMWAELK